MGNVENAISEPLDFKMFWGSMPPDSPTNLGLLSLIFEAPSFENNYAPSSQTVESRTPLLVSVHPWDKSSLKKGLIMSNKFGMNSN